MQRSSKTQWPTFHIVVFIFIYVLSINFCLANLYYPKSPDDENIVISEGIWEKESRTPKPLASKLRQGASRFFDVGGLLTAFGLKQGASMFALVIFPILFPMMILLGVAMFVISMFGSAGVAVAGRRSDIPNNSPVGSSIGVVGGYKQDRYGVPTSFLTNREGLAFDAIENDNCVERFVCEILQRGGSSVIGKKGTFEILQGLSVNPIILPNSSPGKKSRKVWNCSSLKCNWEKWIPWSGDDGNVNKS